MINFCEISDVAGSNTTPTNESGADSAISGYDSSKRPIFISGLKSFELCFIYRSRAKVTLEIFNIASLCQEFGGSRFDSLHNGSATGTKGQKFSSMPMMPFGGNINTELAKFRCK